MDRKAEEFHLENVRAILRDFMSEGSGLTDSSVDFVFLFSILHADDPGPNPGDRTIVPTFLGFAKS